MPKFVALKEADEEKDESVVSEEQNDESEDEGAEEDSNEDEGPVTFKTRSEYIEHMNGAIKKRLARESRKTASIVAERDTLKEKVAELTPLSEGKDKSDQVVASLSKQVADLLSYQKATERNELVRNIAKEHGLPDELLPRVKGDDEDSISEDIQELAELWKVSAKPVKTPGSKSTKPPSVEGKGGKGSGGKGGDEDDSANDPKKIARKVGRFGHRPVFIDNS
jgi:hypothetical protein